MWKVFSLKIIIDILTVQKTFDEGDVTVVKRCQHRPEVDILRFAGDEVASGVSLSSACTRSTSQSAQRVKPCRYSDLHLGQNIVTSLDLEVILSRSVLSLTPDGLQRFSRSTSKKPLLCLYSKNHPIKLQGQIYQLSHWKSRPSCSNFV